MGITSRACLIGGALLLVFSAAVQADNALTNQEADLYSGPDSSYPVVAQLDSDTPIQVMGCLEDWSWCDVAVENTRGWLYSPDITYAYQGGYVPLYSYAPALGIAVLPFAIDVYWGRYYHDRPWYSRRTEWEHREIHHRRPPGPPPSASLPPRPQPRQAVRPGDHPIHPGRGESSQREERPHLDESPRRDADRHGSAGDNRNLSRPQEPPRVEPHAMTPAPNPPPHEARHETPHEDRPHPNPAPHATPPPHADHPRSERPGPGEPPKQDEKPH